MTYHTQTTALDEIGQLLADQGLDGLADALRVLLFYPSAVEKGLRSERALKLAVAEMYVQGVSTRKVATITETLCGLEVTTAQVSRAAQALDAELEKWRSRPLGEMTYLILDTRYEKLRHDGQVVSRAVLVVIGIGPEGKRSVLGVGVSLSEAEVDWRDFRAGLQVLGNDAQCPGAHGWRRLATRPSDSRPTDRPVSAGERRTGSAAASMDQDLIGGPVR